MTFPLALYPVRASDGLPDETNVSESQSDRHLIAGYVNPVIAALNALADRVTALESVAPAPVPVPDPMPSPSAFTLEATRDVIVERLSTAPSSGTHYSEYRLRDAAGAVIDGALVSWGVSDAAAVREATYQAAAQAFVVAQPLRAGTITVLATYQGETATHTLTLQMATAAPPPTPTPPTPTVPPSIQIPITAAQEQALLAAPLGAVIELVGPSTVHEVVLQ